MSVTTPSASTPPWEVEGLTLTGREEKLASFLFSRGKTAQLDRLMTRARSGSSPCDGLTSPCVYASGLSERAPRSSSARKEAFPPLVARKSGEHRRPSGEINRQHANRSGEKEKENRHANRPRSPTGASSGKKGDRKSVV